MMYHDDVMMYHDDVMMYRDDVMVWGVTCRSAQVAARIHVSTTEPVSKHCLRSASTSENLSISLAS